MMHIKDTKKINSISYCNNSFEKKVTVEITQK